jgi:hypothetical protein
LLAGDGAGDDAAPPGDAENPTQAFIAQLKGMAGLGEVPEDAEWLSLFRQNDSGALEDAGKLAVSIQVCSVYECVYSAGGCRQACSLDPGTR